jgi:hypothetical protein
MMKLVCVDPACVPEIWPYVEPMIRCALHRSISTDLLTVTTKLLRQQALLWIAWDGERIRAAAVTSINTANGRKRCVIVACGGSGMKDWLSLIQEVEQYARSEGCISVAIIGRRGWQRRLKEYRPVAVSLEKAL